MLSTTKPTHILLFSPHSLLQRFVGQQFGENWWQCIFRITKIKTFIIAQLRPYSSSLAGIKPFKILACFVSTTNVFSFYHLYPRKNTNTLWIPPTQHNRLDRSEEHLPLSLSVSLCFRNGSINIFPFSKLVWRPLHMLRRLVWMATMKGTWYNNKGSRSLSNPIQLFYWSVSCMLFFVPHTHARTLTAKSERFAPTLRNAHWALKRKSVNAITIGWYLRWMFFFGSESHSIFSVDDCTNEFSFQ